MFYQPVTEYTRAAKVGSELVSNTSDILSNQVVMTIIGFIIAGLLSIVVWFLIREITKKDKIAEDLDRFEAKITDDIKKVTANFTVELRDMANRSTMALEALNKAISQLALAMTEQRVWMSEHYVSKSDYKESVEIIHGRITKTATKLDDLSSCPRKDCPVSNGDPRSSQQ
jgi:phosphate/sulfate permease